MADYTGKRVGNYTITKKLGDGGFATVYLAQHTVLEKKTAVKLLLEEWINEADVVSRFFDEARTMERLKDHPNIVSIMDIASPEICEKEGVPPYFIMEFMDGKSLEQIIHSDESLTLERIVEICTCGLTALEHCHKLGVVHRDIKPSNILLAGDGKVKLTDFGIAKAKVNTSKTGAGLTLGSTDYMSPEQAQGKRDLDHRSDIYSFGVTMYEMVVGQLPFISDNPTSVAMMHITEEPKPPRSYGDVIPERLSNIILRAMEKKPEQRYQSAQEMLDALKTLNEPEKEVEENVPTVDLSKEENKELPEDSIRHDEQSTGKRTTVKASKIQEAARNPAVINAIRLALIMVVATGLFFLVFKLLGEMKKGTATLEAVLPEMKEVQISLGDDLIGTSPLTLTKEAGSYRITFRAKGYLDEVFKLDLKEQQTVIVKRPMKAPLLPETLEKISRTMDQFSSALASAGKKKPAVIGEAVKKIQDTLDDYALNPEPHLLYLEFCKKNQLLQAAENYYREASGKSPSNVQYLVLLGKVLMEKGEAKGALDTLSKAWTIDQSNILLLNSLGSYFVKEGNKARAKQYFALSLYLKKDQTEIEQTLKGL